MDISANSRPSLDMPASPMVSPASALLSGGSYNLDPKSPAEKHLLAVRASRYFSDDCDVFWRAGLTLPVALSRDVWQALPARRDHRCLTSQLGPKIPSPLILLFLVSAMWTRGVRNSAPLRACSPTDETSTVKAPTDRIAIHRQHILVAVA